MSGFSSIIIAGQVTKILKPPLISKFVNLSTVRNAGIITLDRHKFNYEMTV